MSFVVVDTDTHDVVGPFESAAEAKKYFLALAQYEEWGDVCKLIDKTGSPFLNDQEGAGAFMDGLVVIEVSPPSENIPR
jgi:hypothetical protein